MVLGKAISIFRHTSYIVVALMFVNFKTLRFPCYTEALLSFRQFAPTQSTMKSTFSRLLTTPHVARDSNFLRQEFVDRPPILASRKSNNIRKTGRGRKKARDMKRPVSDAFLEAKSILQEMRTLSEVTQWFDELLLVANEYESPFKQFYPYEHTQFIQELASRNADKAILDYIRNFSDHSVFVYASAISGLSGAPAPSSRKVTSKLRSQRQALDLLSDMDDRGVIPNKYVFTAIINHAQNASDATKLLSDLQQRYPRIRLGREVYNAAIHACTRQEEPTDPKMSVDGEETWQTALGLFLQMKKKGLKPDQQTYSSLILSCGQAGQVRVAMSLLEEMPMPPNQFVWGAALTVCAKVGDAERATDVMERMMKCGTKLNSRHIGAYISALAKAGEDQVVLEMMDGLKRRTPVRLSLYGSNSFVIPPVPCDIVLINSAIHACSQANNHQEAKRLFDELKRGEFIGSQTSRSSVGDSPIRPDEITYNTLLSSCRNATEAKVLVREMRFSRRHRYGQVPPTMKTYTLAINACKRAQDLDAALFLLRDSEHDGIVPNVYMYSAAIWAAERCGNPDTASKLLEEMEAAECQPNAVSYSGVLSAFASAGQAERTVEIFKRMKENGLKTNKKVFKQLLSAIENGEHSQSQKRQLSLLETVFDHMEPTDFAAQLSGPILEALILFYGMNDRFDDALEVFEKIYGPANGPCLRAILSACSLSRRWEEAISILHTSDIVEGAAGPARLDMRAIGFAVIACAKSGEVDEASNLLELYGRPSQPGHDDAERSTLPVAAINSMIAACGRCGKPDMALKVLNDMHPRYGVSPDEVTYRSAAIACNQAQHESKRRHGGEFDEKDEGVVSFQWWECALSLLRRMKEEGMKPDVQTYSSVISACESAGEWQRALGVLRQVVDDHDNLNLFCFNAAISACEKGGAWVEALELYYRMIDKGGPVTPNFVTISSLILALDRAGQEELAQDVFENGLKKRIFQPWTRTRCASSGTPIRAIDMHSFSSAMARIAIRSVMESLLSGSNPSHNIDNPLVIIVGKGRGSTSEPVLMPFVRNLFEQNYGIIPQADPNNSGRLIVHGRDLRSYVDRHQWSES